MILLKINRDRKSFSVINCLCLGGESVAPYSAVLAVTKLFEFITLSKFKFFGFVNTFSLHFVDTSSAWGGILVKPLHALALLPISFSLLSGCLSVDSLAVLFPVEPGSIVLASILPSVDSISMLSVI